MKSCTQDDPDIRNCKETVPETPWDSGDAPPLQLRPKPGQGEGGGVSVRSVEINCCEASREVKVPFNDKHYTGALKAFVLLGNHALFAIGWW